jgi:mannose-6-phosphate isomerase-like protein (cupin superfamily)
MMLAMAGALAAGGPASAQTAPAPTPSAQVPLPDKTFGSAGDIAALVAAAKAKAKPGDSNIGQNLLSLAPYKVSVEYRPLRGAASVHEVDAELIYVVQGSGAIQIGGVMMNVKRVNATNLTGDSIEGGETRALAKGDVLIVPQNTPHQVVSVDSTLVFLTFHVPRT